VTASDESLLKKKEKNVYVLKKDVLIDDKGLKKGDRIKIVVTAGREWVKVYAYPKKVESLKAERYLILYLFEDDFPEKKFNTGYFNERLAEVVEKAPASSHGKKRR
jgi:type II secretion system-associated lipoprotein